MDPQQRDRPSVLPELDPPDSSDKPWYKAIGPGLITGVADDDPSGIGTYSQCGASFGYAQLWLVPFCIPLMIAVQEMCGRVGVVTGRGIAAVLKDCYPRWLLYVVVVLLLAANVLNVYADLNVMAASASMLFGLPQFVWLTVITAVIVLLQILLSYHSYAKILKYTCLALLAYVVVPFFKGSHNDWGAIANHLVTPYWSRKLDYQLAAVAFLGTTISPYLFFWQAGETVEEVVERHEEGDDGKRNCVVRESEVRNVRADTVVGMITSQLGAFFMVVAAAGTLHVNGHATDINTAQDAAKALSPLGPSAVWLFTLGMIGCGMLAVPTLAGSAAYAVSEAAGWRYGLYRRFNQAPKFYLTVVAVLVAGYAMNFLSTISPVKALVYSAVANALAAVPLIFVLMLVCNNKKVLGARTNGIWSNVFGWLTFLCMGAASSFFVWAWATGNAG